MKRKNLTKRVFAYGLAVAMALTTISIIPAPAQAAKKTAKKAAKKAAKKKLAISKKKLTLTVGKKAKLKVKKATKKVKWSTNKKKVVKVIKATGKKKVKATIKALKAGKATVIAKVGKKKLKCKVTVKAETPKLKSVTVDAYDSSCVVVALKKKFALNISDFEAFGKKYNEGSFQKSYSLITMTSEDQKTYRVYLAESLNNGDYIKLSVKGVSKTAQYTQQFDAYYEQGREYFKEAGDEVYYNCSELFDNGIGTQSYTINGTLPDGLVYDSNDGTIYGKLNTVGETTVTVDAVDELGRSATSDLTFKVYDDSTIVAPKGRTNLKLDEETEKKAALITEANKSLLAEDRDYWRSVSIEPRGGSGNYIFTLETPDNSEVRLSTDKTDINTNTVTRKPSTMTRLRIPYSVTEGEHTYTITIADAMDASRTCKTTVTVNVEKIYDLTGTVKDTKGTNLTSGTIYFIPEDAKSLDDAATADIYSNANGNAPGTAQGTYSLSLKAGTYTVKVSNNGILYHMTKPITVDKADSVADVKVPIRFYTVSGKAVYVNTENALEYKTLYFEKPDYKYEIDFFSAETDDKGNFIVSLPNGEYEVYFEDEYYNRQYLDKKIKINEADVNVGMLKASISRYSVEGIVYNATSVDPVTGAKQMLANTELYFYNAKGKVVTSYTDDNGIYKVHLEGAAAPGLSYKVRADFGEALRTLGTVTVTTENQANTSLQYTFANEQAEMKDIVLGTSMTLTSTGNNDLIGKFTATADGTYIVTAENGADAMNVAVFDENGMVVASYDYDDYYEYDVKFDVENLKAGKTYYVKIIPNSGYNYNQQACAVDLLVEKRLTPQELATVIAEGSSENVTIDNYETKLIKLSLEAGKTYSLSFTADVVYRCAFENYGMSGNEYIDYDYVYADDEYTFSVDETGDYYFSVRYYDRSGYEISTTASIKFDRVITAKDLATVIADGSSQAVTANSDYNETKFIKLSLEAGKTYSLSFTSDEVYECCFENHGTSGDDYIDYYYVYGNDEYTFSVDETGDYYFSVRYYDSSWDTMTGTATINFRSVSY